ncbi:MAG TPA: formylglycine-generating enzyme family protein [Planctomycetes bacterium]|nr:formylglycine-generating enzyme family protein [Planctomycetota bacterium]
MGYESIGVFEIMKQCRSLHLDRTGMSILAAFAALFVCGVGRAQSLDAMASYKESIPGCSHVVEMVSIPVGKDGYPRQFTMGAPKTEPGFRPGEGPPVEVVMEPFWIGKFEITWDVYDQFRKEYSIDIEKRLSRKSAGAEAWADAVSIPTPLWEQDSAPILEGLGTEGGYPVADISQFAARQFTKWLSKKTGHFYRLPTEAEWEYAARAGTTTPWFFGTDKKKLEEYAWYFDNSSYEDPDKGHPDFGAGYRKVGSKKPNPWGLYDVYGNVAEWVVDAYDKDHYAKLGKGPVHWRDTIAWPKTIFPCVVRGGHWEAEPEDCRSASRLHSEPKWQYRDPQIPKSIWWFTDAFHVGFRIVRPLKEPSAQEKLRFWDGEIPGIRDVLDEGGKQARKVIRPGAAK